MVLPRTISLCLLSLVAGSASAFAQETPAAPPPETDSAAENIVVTAPYRRTRTDLLSSVSVLSGVDLAAEAKGQIGDTLTRQPGVSATSFGPGASRPVLRGFSGERIRVLTDGIGSIDLSNLSADHAVAIDPLTAERVEVLRGPATLQYGSSAIGGVVNVIDRRIPRRIPRDGVHLEGVAGYSTAADSWNAGSGVDVAVSDRLALHADGNYMDAGDLETGGFILTPAIRAAARAFGNPLADQHGRLPNSSVTTYSGGVGGAFLDDGGELGLSLGYYNTDYGIPIRPAVAPGQEEEAARIHLRQYRLDARGEVDFDGFFESLKVRFAAADYRHQELAEGEVGTIFKSKGIEGRAELVQAKRGGWQGALGAQFYASDLKIEGDERLLPDNMQTGVSAFVMQEYETGPVQLEASGRVERTNVDAPSAGFDKSFTAGSVALGGSVGLGGDFRAGVNLSRTARPPSANELLVFGPHIATQSFEIGNPALRLEKQSGAEAFLRADGISGSVDISAYYSRFDGFVYEATTGVFLEGLPVFRTTQGDATYWGLEFQGRHDLWQSGDWTFGGDLLADYVHATIDDVGPAPRIPPLRLLGGLEAESDRLDGRLEVEWADDQTRISDFETPTDGYTVVNAQLTFRPFEHDGVSIILRGENLTDRVVRRHASFLKDFAPLAGRDIRLTLRATF
jgi:iron complex outermembrane receptor protein